MQQTKFATTTIRGTFWTYSTHYSGKLMAFISMVILARLLLKEDFGVAGYAIVVISFLEVLYDMGVGPALIYHRDDPDAPDTAFWIGLAVGIILLGITWLIAPFVGMFFNDPRAIAVTRGLALTFPLTALGNIHDTLLQKKLAFRQSFAPNLVKAIGKGGISIGLAFLGFGAWSLVWGQVGGTLIGVIAFWWVVPWRPRFVFSLPLARRLLSYGSSTVLLNSVGRILINTDYLFIGRMLGATALGVYTLAFRIPELIILQFCWMISKVIFPVYARMQDDTHAMQRGFVVTMSYVGMATAPLGIGIALLAEPFVITFFGERWIEAVPAMRAIAVYTVLLALTYHAGDVYKAQGRMRLLTMLSLLRAVLLIPALWLAIAYIGTIEAVGWTQAGIAFIGTTVNLIVAGHILKIPFKTLFDALLPAISGVALMTVAVLATQAATTTLPALVQLISGVGAGGVAYLAALWWLQRDLVIQAGNTLRAALVGRG